MERSPKFHHFNTYDWDVDDVIPGDGAIAPGTTAWNFLDQDLTTCYTLAHTPFIIVGLVKDIDIDGAEIFTYYLFTRHGILITMKSRYPAKEG